MLVEIINLDPESGLQKRLTCKKNLYKKHHFIALAKKLSKPWTWTEVPSGLQTVKQNLVHSKQTVVSAHVTSYHHLLKSIFNTKLWKQIIKYADTEIDKGSSFSSSLDLNIYINC